MVEQTNVGAVLHRDHCGRIAPANWGSYFRRVFQFQKSSMNKDGCPGDLYQCGHKKTGRSLSRNPGLE